MEMEVAIDSVGDDAVSAHDTTDANASAASSLITMSEVGSTGLFGTPEPEDHQIATENPNSDPSFAGTMTDEQHDTTNTGATTANNPSIMSELGSAGLFGTPEPEDHRVATDIPTSDPIFTGTMAKKQHAVDIMPYNPFEIVQALNSQPAITATMNEEQHAAEIMTGDPFEVVQVLNSQLAITDIMTKGQHIDINAVDPSEIEQVPNSQPAITEVVAEGQHAANFTADNPPEVEQAPDSGSVFNGGMTQEQDAAGIMVDDPFQAEESGQPIGDADALMLDAVLHMATSTWEERDGTNTSPEDIPANALDSVYGEDPDHHMGVGHDPDYHFLEHGLTERELTSALHDSTQSEDDGNAPFGGVMEEEDLPEGEAATTLFDDPNQDGGRAYESDVWEEAGSDEDDDLARQSLANIVAMERRLDKKPKIVRRGRYDMGSEDDSSSSSEDDDSEEKSDEDEDADEDVDEDLMAAIEQQHAANQEAYGIVNRDGQDKEMPDAGSVQPQGSQVFRQEFMRGFNRDSGTWDMAVSRDISPFHLPGTNHASVASVAEGVQTLPNGMVRPIRHVSDDSGEEDDDDQPALEDSDDNYDDDSPGGMVPEHGPSITVPADVEDDEMDMADIMNEIINAPVAPKQPTPPPQPKPKPKRTVGQGKKRSLDEMLVGRQHAEPEESRLVEGISHGATHLPFVPTRLRAAKRGPRGTPRKPVGDEVAKPGLPPPQDPAVPAPKPVAILPNPTYGLPMPSLPMPSSNLPMPTSEQPLANVNPLRDSILAVPQLASIEDAQAAMFASMTQAKRSGVTLFDTPRVAPVEMDAVPGADWPERAADQPEEDINMDIGDNSWMEFGENSRNEDVEYLELRRRVRSMEKRLAKGRLSMGEQLTLLRMKEEAARLQKREPQRRPPFEDGDSDEEEGSEDETSGANPEKAEERRRSKRRKFAEQKNQEAFELAMQKDKGQPTNIPTSSRVRRPRNAREVRQRDAEQQARLEEGAFFSEDKAGKSKQSNDETPPPDQRARKKLFKNRLATKPNDGHDVIMAKVLRLINPTADAISQRLAQRQLVFPEFEASTKEQQFKQIADLVASLPADMDPQAKKTAKSQMAELKRAARNFGFGRVKVKDGKWHLQGMISGLYHHQLEGSNWMIDRELAAGDPKGGILADSMGLGKTVTTLATIVGNPPEPKDIERRQKATLVVVPASLVGQWEDEVEKHVKSETLRKVQVYRKSSKLKLRVIEDCDIVITTYAEILTSYNINMTEDDAASADLIGMDKWKELNQDQQGVLHQIEWYRVVLDEAHTIKNYKAKQTQACFALKSQYKWCLTGTPLMNSLEELYPYCKLLKCQWTSSFKEFKDAYGNPNSLDAAKRLSVLLHMIMKRRTFSDTMLGRPLINLPAAKSEQKVVKLTEEEVVIYRIVENKFREGINQQLRMGPGERQKNYAHMLSKLLRLRQAVAHPFLLGGLIRDTFDGSDLAFLRRKMQRLNKSKVRIYNQIKEWILPDGDKGRAMPFGNSNFGEHFEFNVFLDTVNHKEANKRTQCAHCKDVPSYPQVANCHHIFCKDCIEGQQTESQSAGLVIPQYACPMCDTLVGDWTPYQNVAKEGASQTSRQAQQSRKKAKKDDICPAFKPSVSGSWVGLCEANPQLLVPSSKAIAVKALLTKWRNEAPDDKVIIFTQFRAMARVIGLMCQREKIKHIYLTGDMPHKVRQDAIDQFKNDKKLKVMIANLKVGGVGLNLAVANRVISVDPWWNHCIEQQAFGRVFRYGQTKVTHFVRLFAKDTVDYRIRSLQKDKITAIDDAMLSGKMTNLPPLGLEEIAGLFGQLVEDNDGTLQVQADCAEEEDPVPDFGDTDDSDSDDAAEGGDK